MDQPEQYAQQPPPQQHQRLSSSLLPPPYPLLPGSSYNNRFYDRESLLKTASITESAVGLPASVTRPLTSLKEDKPEDASTPSSSQLQPPSNQPSTQYSQPSNTCRFISSSHVYTSPDGFGQSAEPVATRVESPEQLETDTAEQYKAWLTTPPQVPSPLLRLAHQPSRQHSRNWSKAKGTPLPQTSPKMGQDFCQTPAPNLPSSRQDLEILEKLKDSIINSQREFFRSVPQPALPPINPLSQAGTRYAPYTRWSSQPSPGPPYNNRLIALPPINSPPRASTRYVPNLRHLSPSSAKQESHSLSHREPPESSGSQSVPLRHNPTEDSVSSTSGFMKKLHKYAPALASSPLVWRRGLNQSNYSGCSKISAFSMSFRGVPEEIALSSRMWTNSQNRSCLGCSNTVTSSPLSGN